MKSALALLLFALLSAWPLTAAADPLVMRCEYQSSISRNCGGCLAKFGSGTGLSWVKPSAAMNELVKPASDDFYVVLGKAKPTDLIATSTTAIEGPARCSEITGSATAASLLSIAPPSQPPPPVVPPPTGKLTITASKTLAPIGELVHIEWGGYTGDDCKLSGSWGMDGFAHSPMWLDPPVQLGKSVYTITCNTQTATVIVQGWRAPPCKPSADEIITKSVSHYRLGKFRCDTPRGIQEYGRLLDLDIPATKIEMPAGLLSRDRIAEFDRKVFTLPLSAIDEQVFAEFNAETKLVAQVTNTVAGAIDAPMFVRNPDWTQGPASKKRAKIGADCNWEMRLVKIVNGVEVGTPYFAVVGETDLYANCKLTGVITK